MSYSLAHNITISFLPYYSKYKPQNDDFIHFSLFKSKIKEKDICFDNINYIYKYLDLSKYYDIEIEFIDFTNNSDIKTISYINDNNKYLLFYDGFHKEKWCINIKNAINICAIHHNLENEMQNKYYYKNNDFEMQNTC